MGEFLNFFIEVGKLKRMPRRGWVLRGIKNPECIASHTFRMAIMAWLLGKEKKLNINKIIKMALIHDLCEVYAGDTTPYHKIIPKEKKDWEKITQKWPRFSKNDKEKFFYEKHNKEDRALKKIVSKLSPALKKEITNLWNDYENGLTAEGRFVRQVDRVENLLQAMEYWKEGKRFAIKPWWIQIEELVDDPVLLEFIRALGNKFYQKYKH